ncbi:protein unzipped [Toxorhynchites rutilus septentrionalis]|uniref:protein unzipped n=1 Tax=Toxorhynchites rutilus septentrionalis TaxID=329112 RepID=UPI00247846E6|nr:protein unzipped [Toxorhynchites rutilus septentrionalis]XP_055624571.1 protein unzipped [Toxorhynchites rutilus septentrionalis]XP_055624572.1 protein unzipped [Toxorhynchites rutilus septentrionalis]
MSTRRRLGPSLPNSRWPCMAIFLLQLVTNGDSLAMANSVFKAFSKDQTMTSSTLAWEKFNGEKTQLQFAVHTYNPDEHPHPKELIDSDQLMHESYVCRIQVEGIYCAGQTHMEDSSTICTASLQSDVRRHRTFEVLVNRGGGGKLKWQPWNKYRTEKFPGAVSASTGKVDDYYVARVKLEHHGHHHPFIVGNYDPLAKLGGRIYAPLPGAPDTMEYERGDILVEIEPVQYELRNIKLNKLRTVIKKNTTILGATVLSNEEDITNQAETVITYDYAKVTYYGRQEGVVNGIPTKVIDPRTQQAVDMYWGVELPERKFETKSINTILQPGTAINVTLLGNYTEMEAPYHAILKAYYDDNSDAVSRKLGGYMLSKDMEDVKIEFSPIYWIENGTLVPTTTTTTTTTTTSTTEPTTTNEAVPIHNTPIDDSDNFQLDDDMSNEIDRLVANGREEVASSRSVDKPEGSVSLSSVGGASKGGHNAASGLHRWSTTTVIAAAAAAALLLAQRI